jgi:hypothetical protein
MTLPDLCEKAQAGSFGKILSGLKMARIYVAITGTEILEGLQC